MKRFVSLSFFLVACGSAPPPAAPPVVHLPAGVRWSHPLSDSHHLQALAVSNAVDASDPAVFVLTSSPQGGFIERVVASSGVSLGAAWPWSDAAAVAMDVEDDVLWLAARALLHEVGAADGRPVHTNTLEGGVELSAIEVGYGQTTFGVDGRSGKVFAVGDEGAELLAEGADLQGAKSLLLDGGKLLVGASTGVIAFDLRTRERVALVNGEGAEVRGVAIDHVGYYVVSLGDRLIRVTPEGLALPLTPPVPVTGPLAFDARSRTLIAVGLDGLAVVGLDYLALTNDSAEAWTARDAKPMHPFREGGYELTGAEYWPYRGPSEPNYPDDVLWGFYPEQGVVFEGAAAPATATSAAVACAEQSYNALRAFLSTDPAELREAVEHGTSNRFYLWVNDYSEAANPFPKPLRAGRLWYWQRNPAVVGRIPGFWKWETTLTQSGECQIPQEPHEGLAAKLLELRGPTPR